MIEVDEQIAAVRRRVEERAGARVLTIEQELPADAADLWDALTNAERLPRWFLPVEGDLRAGGRYALEGNASGVVESCDPPSSFTATWEFGGDTTRIAVRVEPAGDDRARLTLEHETPASAPAWGEFGPGATGIGWDLSLIGLALHLGSRGAFDPDAGTTWAGEDDGERFLVLSGEAWRDAHLAAGADPAAARVAAERTIAAYLGSAEDAD